MTPFLVIAWGILLIVGGYVLYRQRLITSQAQEMAIEAEEKIRQLQNDLRQRDRAIADLQQGMAKCDDLLLKLRRQMSESDSFITDMTRQLAANDSIITNLRGQIETRERESMQSKALFSTISNVAYDLVFVLDEDRTIIALNKSADALFGQKHPIGEQLTDVIDSPMLDDIVHRALTEDESLEEQLTFDGRIYRARTQVMIYQRQHTFIGVALQDITQLVRLNRARRDMVANISHELRTPIAKIRLIIDSLFHEQDKPKRKASIASLRDIARETDALQRVVEEMYDLSRIESGQAIMKLVDAPLIDIVDEAIEHVTNQLESKNLQVVHYVPDKINVLCDREQTRRILVNLIRNAIKWSPQGEVITVSATVNDNEEDITVSVFDNGPGIPPDQVERIFERFYQIDPSRTGSKTSGSGLGLAICKHIAEAQGGTIWAEDNSKGGGGRFLFTLLTGEAQNNMVATGEHIVSENVMPESVPTALQIAEDVVDAQDAAERQQSKSIYYDGFDDDWDDDDDDWDDDDDDWDDDDIDDIDKAQDDHPMQHHPNAPDEMPDNAQ